MWSLFRKIFHHLSPQSPRQESSRLFPQGVDKLRTIFSASEELEGPIGAISAREAFELAEELVFGFDSEARLLCIESSGKVDAQGRSEGWLFDFQLPLRWGYARFTFKTGTATESVALKLTPFAAEGSALDRMLADGQDGFVEQQWKVESERQSVLTHRFQDSTAVLKRWMDDGNSIASPNTIVLRATTPPLGQARWEVYDSPGNKKSLYKAPIE